MPEDKNLNNINELLITAEAAIHAAKDLLEQTGAITGSSASGPSYSQKAAQVSSSGDSEGRVIEGVFDGQNMVDSKGTIFPIPANYASKSKLIPGDVLKLTVTEEGKFLYKQIGPVERKNVVGPLVYTDGRYQILAAGKAYNVLLASVTYFHASVGDEITLIIPAREESDWGAIEAVLPKFADDESVTTESIADELDI